MHPSFCGAVVQHHLQRIFWAKPTTQVLRPSSRSVGDCVLFNLKMVSNVSFREQLKLMRPSFRINRFDDVVPARRLVWKDRHKIQESDRSNVQDFFLSTRRTPGSESPRRLTRTFSKMWHEFKLTLFSGMCCHHQFASAQHVQC